MHNSRGEWETMRAPIASAAEGHSRLRDRRSPIANAAGASDAPSQIAIGDSRFARSSPSPPPSKKSAPARSAFCPKTSDGKTYGRALTVADRLGQDRVLLAKWIRRLTNWNGRQAPLAVWEEKIVPLVKQKLAQQKTPVVALPERGRSASSPWSALRT